MGIVIAAAVLLTRRAFVVPFRSGMAIRHRRSGSCSATGLACSGTTSRRVGHLPPCRWWWSSQSQPCSRLQPLLSGDEESPENGEVPVVNREVPVTADVNTDVKVGRTGVSKWRRAAIVAALAAVGVGLTACPSGGGGGGGAQNGGGGGATTTTAGGGGGGGGGGGF